MSDENPDKGGVATRVMALSDRTLTWVAGVTALVVALAIGFLVLRPDPSIEVTAYFSRAVGVYAGSDVRVLGVKVGEIESVQPGPDGVKVTFSVDRDVTIPKDASAVVVAPSLVSDRYVQLAPAYLAGPRMGDGTVIPLERTAVPVELDEIYQTVDDLSKALGPKGANKKTSLSPNGSLNDLVVVGADNLQGNGQDLGQTITNLSLAVQTLSAGKDDLFGSVVNLQKFVAALVAHDDAVLAFNTTMAQVTGQLAEERKDLAEAIKTLGTALGQVQQFLLDHKGQLKVTLDKLVSITQLFVDQRQAIGQFLDIAPTALGNLANAYNPVSGTLDTRNDIQDPATLACTLLHNLSQVSPEVDAQLQLGERCSQLFGGSQGIPTVQDLVDAITNAGQNLPLLPGVTG